MGVCGSADSELGDQDGDLGRTTGENTEARSSPEAGGERTTIFFSLFIFFCHPSTLEQTLTSLQQRIWRSRIVAAGAGLVRREPGELVIQRQT